MKLGPVTKLDKRKKIMSKTFDDNTISADCNIYLIFLIFGQLGAIQKPDSRCLVCKTYIFIKRNLLSSKKENTTKISVTQHNV